MNDRPRITTKSAPRRGRWLGAAILAMIMLVVGALTVHVFHLLAAPAPHSTRSVEFEIEAGWGATRIAEELANEGLIRHPQLFALWLRQRQLDRSIGEGVYELSPAMDALEVAARLAEGGTPRVAVVVVPEGFRTSEVGARLAGAGIGDIDEILGLIREPGELRPEYLPEEASLEGYLFPASYSIPLRSSPDEALRMMMARFERELDETTRQALDDAGLSVHEWVTLASMVQAEAANDAEMPIIAGVFLNRLDLEMPLQSDPTVAYGLGIRLAQLNRHEGHFTAAADHPWNTYTRNGLPSGPIGNPGREALMSVLQPVRVNANGEPNLYFMHSRDGSVFRVNTNLEDHQRDVDRYLR